MRSANAKLTGMLVVEDVQPGSGADGVLAPGDILTAIDGKPIPEFFALEDVLDGHVGQQVTVEVQRGRETVRHALDVQSLSAITADETCSLATSQYSAGVDATNSTSTRATGGPIHLRACRNGWGLCPARPPATPVAAGSISIFRRPLVG